MDGRLPAGGACYDDDILDDDCLFLRLRRKVVEHCHENLSDNQSTQYQGANTGHSQCCTQYQGRAPKLVQLPNIHIQLCDIINKFIILGNQYSEIAVLF